MPSYVYTGTSFVTEAILQNLSERVDFSVNTVNKIGYQYAK